MKTDEVIALIKKGKSVEGIILSDISEKQLSFQDALLLVEHGFAITQKNVLYKDSDIVYDPEFDEVEWEGNFSNLREVLSSKGIGENGKEEKMTIELSIRDEAVKDWLRKNTGKLEEIVNKLVVDLYHTERILHS